MAAMHRLAALLVAAAVLGGCSKDHTLQCEPNGRYLRAGSAVPVRVPDDLTPPDETDALQLPSTDAAPAASAEKPCLESPPTFAPAGAGRGRAAAPPSPAPAAPAAGGDREIGN